MSDTVQHQPNPAIHGERPYLRPATRDEVFAEIVAGWRVGGLPLPQDIHIYAFGSLTLAFDDGQQAAVDRWAEYLGVGPCVPHANGRSYWSKGHLSPRVPGWHVRVMCNLPLPAVTQ